MKLELPIPDPVQLDDHSKEMIRVWIANGEMNVSMNLGMWADSEDCDVDECSAWGQLLSDLAKHIANGLSQSHGWNKQDTKLRICSSFASHIDVTDIDLEGTYQE